MCFERCYLLSLCLWVVVRVVRSSLPNNLIAAEIGIPRTFETFVGQHKASRSLLRGCLLIVCQGGSDPPS
jgi:hypothetical protein